MLNANLKKFQIWKMAPLAYAVPKRESPEKVAGIPEFVKSQAVLARSRLSKRQIRLKRS